MLTESFTLGLGQPKIENVSSLVLRPKRISFEITDQVLSLYNLINRIPLRLKWQFLAKKYKRKYDIANIRKLHNLTKNFNYIIANNLRRFFGRWIFRFAWSKMVLSIKSLERRKHMISFLPQLELEYHKYYQKKWKKLQTKLLRESRIESILENVENENRELLLKKYFSSWVNNYHDLINYYLDLRNKWILLANSIKFKYTDFALRRAFYEHKYRSMWVHLCHELKVSEIYRYFNYLSNARKLLLLAKDYLSLKRYQALQKASSRIAYRRRWQRWFNLLKTLYKCQLFENMHDSLERKRTLSHLIKGYVKRKHSMAIQHVLNKYQNKLLERANRMILKKALLEWKQQAEIKKYTRHFMRNIFSESVLNYQYSLMNHSAIIIQSYFRNFLIEKQRQRKMLYHSFIKWRKISRRLTYNIVEFPDIILNVKIPLNFSCSIYSNLNVLQLDQRIFDMMPIYYRFKSTNREKRISQIAKKSTFSLPIKLPTTDACPEPLERLNVFKFNKNKVKSFINKKQINQLIPIIDGFIPKISIEIPYNDIFYKNYESSFSDKTDLLFENNVPTVISKDFIKSISKSIQFDDLKCNLNELKCFTKINQIEFLFPKHKRIQNSLCNETIPITFKLLYLIPKNTNFHKLHEFKYKTNSAKLKDLNNTNYIKQIEKKISFNFVENNANNLNFLIGFNGKTKSSHQSNSISPLYYNSKADLINQIQLESNDNSVKCIKNIINSCKISMKLELFSNFSHFDLTDTNKNIVFIGNRIKDFLSPKIDKVYSLLNSHINDSSRIPSGDFPTKQYRRKALDCSFPKSSLFELKIPQIVNLQNKFNKMKFFINFCRNKTIKNHDDFIVFKKEFNYHIQHKNKVYYLHNFSNSLINLNSYNFGKHTQNSIKKDSKLEIILPQKIITSIKHLSSFKNCNQAKYNLSNDHSKYDKALEASHNQLIVDNNLLNIRAKSLSKMSNMCYLNQKQYLFKNDENFEDIIYCSSVIDFNSTIIMLSKYKVKSFHHNHLSTCIKNKNKSDNVKALIDSSNKRVNTKSNLNILSYTYSNIKLRKLNQLQYQSHIPKIRKADSLVLHNNNEEDGYISQVINQTIFNFSINNISCVFNAKAGKLNCLRFANFPNQHHFNITNHTNKKGEIQPRINFEEGIQDQKGLLENKFANKLVCPIIFGEFKTRSYNSMLNYIPSKMIHSNNNSFKSDQVKVLNQIAHKYNPSYNIISLQALPRYKHFNLLVHFNTDSSINANLRSSNMPMINQSFSNQKLSINLTLQTSNRIQLLSSKSPIINITTLSPIKKAKRSIKAIQNFKIPNYQDSNLTHEIISLENIDQTLLKHQLDYSLLLYQIFSSKSLYTLNFTNKYRNFDPNIKIHNTNNFIISHQELNVINSFENSKKKILEKLNILTLPNKSILNKVNNKSNTFHINEQNVAKLILANRLHNIYVLNHATSFTNKSTIDNLSNDFTPQLSSNLNLIIPTNQKSNKISRLRHFEIGYFQNSQLVAINFIIDIPLRCNFNSNHLSTSALYHIFPKSHKFKLQSNITSSLQTTDIENMKIGLMQPELQKCSNITSQKQKIISQFTNFRQPSSMVNIYWRIFEKSILVNNFAYKCSLKYLESFKDSLPLLIADQIEKKYQVFFKNILQNCKTFCRQTAKSNKRKFISPDSNKTVLTNNSQAGSPRYGTFFSQDFLFNFKYLDTCIDKMINPISSFFKKDDKSNQNILLFRKFQILKNGIPIDNVETDEKKQQDNSSTASSITYNFDQTTFTESSETPNFVFTTSDSEPIYVSPRRKSHGKKKKISVGKHLVTYIDLITNEHQYSSEASYVSNSSESGPCSRHTSPIPSVKLNLSPDISFSNSANETDSEPSNQISHSDSHDSVLE